MSTRPADLVRYGRDHPRLSVVSSPVERPAPAIPYDADRWAVDPRPDLEGDSSWWGRLLWTVYHRYGGDPCGLFAALHGLRICGARLRSQGGQLRIDAGEIDGGGVGASYADLRQAHLVPHTDELRSLLQEVSPWA